MTVGDNCLVEWLMQWYRHHCDGDWEHQHGVRICTIDNPGWSLDVDLAGVFPLGTSAPHEFVERSEDDWLFVEVKDGFFRARGGPLNLREMLEAFRAFVSRKEA